MDVVVTGAAGFIGSNLARRLVDDGHTVRALDNLATGRASNLEGSGVDLVVGDVCDLDAVRAVVAAADVVFHQAALPSVPRSVADPLASHAANATGTLNVLVAARDAGVRRVVTASSSSVYGPSPELPKRETMPLHPISPYAASKLAAEGYCRAFHTVYGLETVALRYFNVFGPRQDPGGQYSAVIPKFIAAYLAGEAPVIDGDGEQSRDFTYVANVVEANVLAATADGAAGRTFNVACGERTTINELAAMVAELAGRPRIAAEHGPPRPGDVQQSYADVSAAHDVLGYRVAVGLRDGLKRTVEWFAAGSE